MESIEKKQNFVETITYIVLNVKLLFSFLFLCVFSVQVHAQILNIERYRIEKDTTKTFLIKATAGLNVYNRSASADAPVNLFGYNLNLNTLYHPGQHAYILVSNFDYLRINEADFLNFGLVHGRAVFNWEKQSNIETFIQYSFDNFRGLEPRWIAGGTLRHKAINSDKITLILGLGGIYEKERWVHPNTEQIIQVDFIKSANYVSFRYTINDYVDFNLVNYYQVGYDKSIEGFRNRFSGNLNLNTKITDKISFTNNLEFSFEDKPIVPITSFIYAFRTGLSFDF